MAGGNGPGSNNNQLKSPRCLHVRGNGLLHVCDYGNKRIQKWDVNPTTITTVTDDTNGDSPNGLVVESGGGIYLADDRLHYVLKYTGRLISVVAAGDKGNSGSRDDLLDTPSGLTLDNSLNLYVVDTGNNRVVRWNHQSTRGDPILNSGSIGLTDIAMSSKLSNLLYLSSMNTNQVVSWQINGVGPIKTFRSVNSSNSSLSLPHGIILDDDENLYVADSGYTRVVMFCAGSTMGRVIINGVSASPNFLSVVDIGLDSDRNLYVLDRTDAKVIRFDLN